MSTISDNIAKIKENIMISLAKSHRSDENVEILCASKHRNINELLEANNEGISVFGENIVQEFVAKYDERLTWDIIGRLQTNKVKYVVGKVRLIQSLDRLALADEIEKVSAKRGIVQRCLVEVNTGNEEAKGGISFDKIDEFLNTLQNYEHLRVVGLMAVAPKTDEDTLYKLFSAMKVKFDEAKDRFPELKYLSMGMSADYKIAVECGANMIRPGKAIFEP